MTRYLCTVCLEEFDHPGEAEEHYRATHDEDVPGQVIEEQQSQPVANVQTVRP